MQLRILAPRLAVVRLEPDAAVPRWATSGPLSSVTRTPAELSIVVEESRVPAGLTAERGFRGIEVVGPLDFSLVGILAGITGCLAAAQISVFVLSTYDTDYVLVPQTALTQAEVVLRREGYQITPPPDPAD